MKEYLGDSVYAEIEDCAWPEIKLTTNNGELDDNGTIYLEQEVIVALLAFVKKNFPKLIQ